MNEVDPNEVDGEPVSEPLSRRRRRLFTALALVLSLVLFLALGEVLARILGGPQLAVPRDEKSLSYAHHETLGWFPVPGSQATVRGFNQFTVEHNARGFRDSEVEPDGRPAMVVLGDSMVWGFDVEEEERFTEKMRHMLPDWQIFNLGVSGYGTDQQLLLLQEHIQHYRPRLVLLVFHPENDFDDNTAPIRYEGYPKPWFTLDADGLELRGVPVPESRNHRLVRHPWLANSRLAVTLLDLWIRQRTAGAATGGDDPTFALIEVMARTAAENGAALVVGLTVRHDALQAHLTQRRISWLSLENPYRYRTHGWHWTPSGHSFVSMAVGQYLWKAGFLQDQ